jgi:hypothetical protein
MSNLLSTKRGRGRLPAYWQSKPALFLKLQLLLPEMPQIIGNVTMMMPLLLLRLFYGAVGYLLLSIQYICRQPGAAMSLCMRCPLPHLAPSFEMS